jgi:transcription antitermination factor NusG
MEGEGQGDGCARYDTKRLEMAWHILTVAPQSEFKVRDELHELGWSALVPVEFRFRRPPRGGKPLPIRKPRLPGYVFADVATWRGLHGLRGWVGSIHSDGGPYRLTGAQVAAVEALSVPVAAIQTETRWRVGEKVRIKRGALAELEGIIEVIRRGKPVASVEMFGKRHQVTLDPEIIERVLPP